MYDQLASDYDRFVDWPSRLSVELPFIEKILEESKHEPGEKPSVLDVACGTGMHALALAEKSYRVSGSDLSAPMITAARNNAARARLDVTFKAAGFGEAASAFGKEQFNAVLCLGNSLPHLLTPQSLSAALIDFRDCLKPGGVLLIQNRNFDAVTLSRNRWMPPQAFTEEDQQWVFQRFYDFESVALIRFNMVTLTRKGDSAWQSRVDSTLLRPLVREELEKEIKEAGFSRHCAFGNLNGDHFDPQTSENLILIARK